MLSIYFICTLYALFTNCNGTYSVLQLQFAIQFNLDSIFYTALDNNSSIIIIDWKKYEYLNFIKQFFKIIFYAGKSMLSRKLLLFYNNRIKINTKWNANKCASI